LITIHVLNFYFVLFVGTVRHRRVVGGQSRKMAKPIFGRGLAMRCERSEHGKSQLSMKYFCTILIFVFYYLFFRVSPSCQQRSVFFASQMRCAVRRLPMRREPEGIATHRPGGLAKAGVHKDCHEPQKLKIPTKVRTSHAPMSFS